MKGILVSILVLSSVSAFAGPDCKADAERNCWDKASAEVIGMNSISVSFESDRRESPGVYIQRYSCVVSKVYGSGDSETLAEYSIKARNTGDWCTIISIIRID